MYDVELILLKSRARKLNTIMYMAGIAVKGTENEKKPQVIVYANNPALLKILVDDHNEMVKVRKAKTPKK
jgi:hypothetical protein